MIKCPGACPGDIYFFQPSGSGVQPLEGTVDLSPVTGAKARSTAALASVALTGTRYRLAPAYTESYALIRAWKAPADGTVTIGGGARMVLGNEVALSVVRIAGQQAAPGQLPADFNRWQVEHSDVSQTNTGGRPTVQLRIGLRRDALRAQLRVVAHPGTPILASG